MGYPPVEAGWPRTLGAVHVPRPVQTRMLQLTGQDRPFRAVALLAGALGLVSTSAIRADPLATVQVVATYLRSYLTCVM